MTLPDLFFPRRCLGCGRQGEYYCAACWSRVKVKRAQFCPNCRRPVLLGRTHSWCRRQTPFGGLISLFPYDGLIEKTIKKLKYKLVTDLAKELTKKSFEKIGQENLPLLKRLQGDWVTVPVPLHPWRQRQRGFNQAEVLARGLATEFGWQLEADLLRRRRYTGPQANLKKEKRFENIRSAFCLSRTFRLPGQLKADFLLFDDVWTTGSTLVESARVLKKAGVRNVWGLTLAR